MSTPKDDAHWSEQVKVHPVEDKNIFNKSAEEIAKYFGDPRVTPEGAGRAVNRLQFYINRAGSHGNANHIEKAREAIRILQARESEKKEKPKVATASAKTPAKVEAHQEIRRLVSQLTTAAEFLKEHELTDLSEPLIRKTVSYISEAASRIESSLPVAEPAEKETEAKHD